VKLVTIPTLAVETLFTKKSHLIIARQTGYEWKNTKQGKTNESN